MLVQINNECYMVGSGVRFRYFTKIKAAIFLVGVRFRYFTIFIKSLFPEC